MRDSIKNVYSFAYLQAIHVYYRLCPFITLRPVTYPNVNVELLIHYKLLYSIPFYKYTPIYLFFC